jgi:hypothetical protein
MYAAASAAARNHARPGPSSVPGSPGAMRLAAPVGQQVTVEQNDAPAPAGRNLGIEDMAKPQVARVSARHAIAAFEGLADVERIAKGEDAFGRNAGVGQRLKKQRRETADAWVLDDHQGSVAIVAVDDLSNAAFDRGAVVQP